MYIYIYTLLKTCIYLYILIYTHTFKNLKMSNVFPEQKNVEDPSRTFAFHLYRATWPGRPREHIRETPGPWQLISLKMVDD